jgi:small subunit ribosomal protein S21
MAIPGDLLHFRGLEVKVHDNDFEDAFRKFKSLIQKEKIISEFKEKQRYEKPSDKKRRKKREAIQKMMLAKLREQQILSGEWDKIQARKEARKNKKIEDRRKKQDSDTSSSR